MKWKFVLISLFVLIGVTLIGSQSVFPKASVPILMYHHLVPEGSESISLFNNSVLSVRHFEEQMQYLAQNGYKTIFMSELKSYLNDPKKSLDKVIVITFDDGYGSNYTYAFPILKQYGLKANIAVVAHDLESEVDLEGNNTNGTFSHRHLTFDQAREMRGSGLVEFGSHTYDSHDTFNRQIKSGETKEEYKKRILSDLLRSRKVMEQELGVEPTYFAYPYGRCNPTLSDLVCCSGFDLAVTIKKGYANKDCSFLRLPRLNVSEKLSLTAFAHLIENK